MADERTEIEAACRDVLDRFMAALNAHDADAMDACMHFPHVRFAGGNIKVYESAGSNPMDLFQRLRDEDDWRYSTWRERELVQFGGNKAHVALSYTRFRGDGSVIGVYESLYVLTRVEGNWGIQMRSSFGP
ncbi:nuclear transport factor 2 family protein [Cupriavidus plantarum]|uniref:Uncharacterized protein n=1 Tax=Cupriavidus plantarum TaxID=942865 RepID=A0A316EUL7_9BURK|nr:nuclear transport factor 2 family protein [Cupriavidus plantarum]NYI00884.1 hypothetical protein [Cupriavidus plantarum]PWK35295.1 hypothetical protein C7419_102573 [Cupriavidus plantarum]REE93740.1 hypothetical protein C7418_2510 [Cupriavidus plantarum]RLK39161.1 hypothetical protein C7417_2693 [Cupriavidus plantarum]CAG2135038.1 hypothetical protein LMG26296_02124 [Cupriavidus plantarum]